MRLIKLTNLTFHYAVISTVTSPSNKAQHLFALHLNSFEAYNLIDLSQIWNISNVIYIIKNL